MAVLVIFGSISIPVQAITGDADDAIFTTMERYHEILNSFGTRYHFTHFIYDNITQPRPDAEYIIYATQYALVEGMSIHYLEDWAGVAGTSIWTDESGLIEWDVYVTQGGLYNISVFYYAYEGRSSDIQRAVFINGEQPFLEANHVEFTRTWVNQLPYIRQDSRGNDLRPVQVEYHTWREELVMDAMGTYNEPLLFYLQPGRNTIGFYSLREPMIISYLRVHQAPVIFSYSEVSAGFAGLNRPSIEEIRIDGQDANRRSSPMLAPQSDNSGPGVTPNSPREIRINHIGGQTWAEPGSWIEWDFEVPESGLYKIAMNVRQHYTRGTSTFRRITINGEVPFSEMEAYSFNFRTGWRVDTLGGEDEPYLFWLEAGTNTIRMQAVLGDYALYYREIQEVIRNLNSLYRQIVMITGLEPDFFRDYRMAERLPNLRYELHAERERLDRIFQELTDMSEGRGERNAIINNMSALLTLIYSDIEAAPRRIHDFRINIGSLGTWLMQVRGQRLAIGEIYILAADAPTPRINNGFFARLWFEIRSLFFSFFIDFNTIGDTLEGDDVGHTTVWLGTGRDQANVIRALMDETFTRENNINVTLKLVDMSTLLPATLSGEGPCVAMMIGADLPMNFGMRGALTDLTVFPDFDEVAARFSEAAMTPLTFDGRAFALPETLTFNMLFYRRDVLYEIGLEPPETWDEVRAAMSVLAQHHMEFGLPLEIGLVGTTAATFIIDITFAMFLFQNGGAFYNEDGSLSALDTDISLSAFRDFTRYFTDYRLPLIYDFANRFRAGDMPMAIADYTNYNMLQVFAPEIRGLWGFRPVPGTIQTDGSINRAVAGGGSSVVMMSQVEDPQASWEFMKWWTSAETQVQYGRGMESLMGAAARHPTANIEAFSQMPWPVRDYENLMAQFAYVQGIPQVPGGYYTARQIRNAFYTAAVQRTVGPREALIDAVRFINNELRAKWIEFGLDVR